MNALEIITASPNGMLDILKVIDITTDTKYIQTPTEGTLREVTMYVVTVRVGRRSVQKVLYPSILQHRAACSSLERVLSVTGINPSTLKDTHHFITPVLVNGYLVKSDDKYSARIGEISCNSAWGETPEHELCVRVW